MAASGTVLRQILQKIPGHLKAVVKKSKLFTFDLGKGLAQILLDRV